ncbi:MAG: DoxX family protein [Phycisphaerae bacterium]
MNDRGLRGRMQALAPLLLRLGAAAVLAVHGMGQVGGVIQGAAQEQVVADAEGVNVTADWGTLKGFGELGIAGLLVVGLMTRLVTAGILAGAGVWAKSAIVDADGGAWAALTQSPDLAPLVVMLLAVVSLSLMVSGCGSLGLDGRLFRRKVTPESAEANL